MSKIRKAIILHGMPSEEEYFDLSGLKPTESHWLPWLREELTKKGITVELPAFPDPYEPVYEKWKEAFEKFSLDEETALIGHSCGAGFLVRWLSENPVRVNKVILVAPWLDPDRGRAPEFFDFTIDRSLGTRTDGVVVFVSRDDDEEILTSARQIEKGIENVVVKECFGKGHFTSGDMHTQKFPELLQELAV
jgi:predicted alpha/beta hydrolase family esterase